MLKIINFNRTFLLKNEVVIVVFSPVAGSLGSPYITLNYTVRRGVWTESSEMDKTKRIAL
jgi:hypothetical protein